MNRKELNRNLIELGFHSIWGNWINNINKQHRLRVRRSRGKNLIIMVTKEGNCYNLDENEHNLKTISTIEELKKLVFYQLYNN